MKIKKKYLIKFIKNKQIIKIYYIILILNWKKHI